MHRVGGRLLFAGLAAASASEPRVPLGECLDHQCEVQVELIQTSSILEWRAGKVAEPPAGPDVFEDSGTTADSLSASSFVEVASEEARRSLIGELLSRDVQARLQESSGNSSSTTTAASASSTTVLAIGNSEGDLVAFLVALGVNVGAALLFCCSFACLRRSHGLVYARKAETPGSHGMQPPDVSGFCTWAVESWRLPVEEVANHANLDHGMFVQFCDTAIMCLLSSGLPAILILCPAHFFAGGGAAGSDNLSRVGFANVVQGSALTWLHPFFVWYTVIVTQAFLLRAQRGFVQKRFQWLRTMPEPRANSVLLHNIPPDLRQEASLRNYLQEQIFGVSDGRSVVRSLYFLKETSELDPFLKQRHLLVQDLQRMTKASEHERRQAVLNAEIKKVDSQLAKQQEIIERSDEYNRDSAFVTFEIRHDAVIVLKLFAADGHGGEDLLAELPPDPDDVIWADLLAPTRLQWLWDALGIFLLLLAGLVMVPLVVVIAGLSSVKSLEAQDANLAAFMDRNPAVPIFWNGLLGPFTLTLVMSFLPAVLTLILGTFFMLKARGWLQYRVQQWYYMYQILLVLFVTSVGAALSGALSYLLKNPLEIPQMLATTFPTCTHFYMNYVVLQIGVHVFGLMRLFVLTKFLFYRCFFEDLTALQRAEPEDQEYHGMGSRSARMTLLYVIALVFSTLCPLITVLAAVTFAVARVVYTYLFVYAEMLKPDLGGLFWQRQLNHAQQGTFLYIALMTAVLLQRAPTPWPGMICASSAVFMGFSYYTFLNRFRWEQLQFSEVPAKGALGGPPMQYGHYKQPQLPAPPPPAPKEVDLVTRAVTTMRQRLNVCGPCGFDDEGPDADDIAAAAAARQARRSKTERSDRLAPPASMDVRRARTEGL
ncbi:unnamed protein product [Symbiodinium natans]|uniref:Uncharacterized protein n=1 Tax=Symbiodinium natans TaxID=878477 RepID=A0A812I6R0_9DINO|nr:unnamed protein product [Symbiodinium natans]